MANVNDVVFISVAGTKPQELSTAVRADVSLELFILAAGTHGLSSCQYVTAFCRLFDVF